MINCGIHTKVCVCVCVVKFVFFRDEQRMYTVEEDSCIDGASVICLQYRQKCRQDNFTPINALSYRITDGVVHIQTETKF